MDIERRYGMSGMQKKELETRMKGLSEEERKVALKCFSLEEISKEMCERALGLEKTLNGIIKYMEGGRDDGC